MQQRTVERSVLAGQILMVVVSALFVALGVNAALASVLVELTPSDVPEPKAAEEDAGALAADGADAGNVLEYNRNMFNQEGDESEVPPPAAAPTEPLDPAATEEPEPVPTDPGAPVLSSLQFLLVGTQVASDPQYSLAMLKGVSGKAAAGDMLYKRTGTTFGEEDDVTTVVLIERDKVYIRRADGSIEYFDIEQTAADIMARKAKTPPPKKSKPAPKSNGPGQAGKGKKVVSGNSATNKPAPRVAASASSVDPNAIVDNGDGSYGIPGDMASAVRNNPKMLKDPKFGAPPQIQPVYKGGAVNGFRVLGVQSGSIYQKLGIRNGDVILSVNDKIVDNPQKALGFFDSLAPGSDAKLKVNRRGKHKTLTYKLQ